MDLEFTRGDTKNFQFKLEDINGQAIVLGNGDALYLTVKKNYNTTTALFQKTIGNGIVYIDGFYKVTINSTDTNNLSYGGYVFDIQVISNEIVKTILLGTITLTPEVTFTSNEV